MTIGGPAQSPSWRVLSTVVHIPMMAQYTVKDLREADYSLNREFISDARGCYGKLLPQSTMEVLHPIDKLTYNR